MRFKLIALLVALVILSNYMSEVTKPVAREITLKHCAPQCVLYLCCVCVLTGVNKEEPELSIATEENQDEEPTKAKKRK